MMPVMMPAPAASAASPMQIGRVDSPVDHAAHEDNGPAVDLLELARLIGEGWAGSVSFGHRDRVTNYRDQRVDVLAMAWAPGERAWVHCPLAGPFESRSPELHAADRAVCALVDALNGDPFYCAMVAAGAVDPLAGR